MIALLLLALQGPDLETLRAADLRLATIGHRLAVANVALCARRAPAPGLVIHTLDQYPTDEQPAARATFRFAAPVSVEAVVPGSTAAAAGVRADDGLLAIDETPVPKPAKPPTSATREATLRALAARPADQPLALTLSDRSVTMAASPGCRTDFELILGPKMTAEADGTTVRIGVRFLERYSDTEVAAVVAHELSHNVLHHRDRLEAAGVKWGVLSEFGRNGRLFRRTEDEADQLSVALLHNAGYDPRGAARFWREHGGDVDGGLFRSRTHASSKDRAAAIDAEAARIPAGAGRTWTPPLLATRDQPLD